MPVPASQVATKPERLSGGRLRVVMAVAMTGTRNGQDWPARGEAIELEADEARQYLDAGICELPEEA